MARALRGSVFKRSDRTVMVLAAIFAVIAAVLVFVALQNAGDDTTTKTVSTGAGQDFVTAVQDIPAGTRLSADMLVVTTIPDDRVLTGGYPGIQPLVGLTTRSDVLKGEQITVSKVGEAQTNDKSLALVVPPGMRAVAIGVEETTAVGGMILPGDVVDVLAVFNETETSVTVLQKIEVLAVAQTAQEPVPPPVGGEATPSVVGRTPEDAEAQPSAGSVTLAVTPEQAQQLVLVSDKATLFLSLRPRGESVDVPLPPSDLSGFGQATPAPAQQ